jgi:hypothetical protein
MNSSNTSSISDASEMDEVLLEFIRLKEIQKNISQELGTVIEK